jgi:Lrp/AsnC family leucine-responsive transcriptional regulator
MNAVQRTGAVARGGRKDAQRLDEIDRRILRALQQDARLTTAQLADKIGLSTTPCWNRLKRLETQGYIDGYIALLNQEKLGCRKR